MSTLSRFLNLSTSLALLALASTNAFAGSRHRNDEQAGAVFTMTNDAVRNEVVMYERSDDGRLRQIGRFGTCGTGSGAALGSQGSVILSCDHHWLFAADAGSNDVAVFEVKSWCLRLVGNYASGGISPVSLTQHGDLLYVLNDGTPNNISGFKIKEDGRLVPLAGSTRPLSGPSVGPAEVQFSKEGDILVVSEKNTNQFSTYEVNRHGVVKGPKVVASAGVTPYGFAFGGRERVFVSEAAGGGVNAGTLSSYNTNDFGEMGVITSALPEYETAPCWVSVTENGRYVYVSNTGSSTVTGYLVRRGGAVVLLDSNGITNHTGPGTSPIDSALSRDSRFLYVLTGGKGSIAEFRIEEDGGLSGIHRVTGLPGTWVGLAAY